MRFDRKWIQWVMECVKSVTYCVNVNEKVAGEARPTRGIRQGDPLSPYLFILIIDVLSIMVSSAAGEGSLKGIKMSRACPSVSHFSLRMTPFFSYKLQRKMLNS